jgi:hypothetical protein
MTSPIDRMVLSVAGKALSVQSLKKTRGNRTKAPHQAPAASPDVAAELASVRHQIEIDLLFARAHLKEIDNAENNEPQDLANYEGEASYRNRNFQDYQTRLAVCAVQIIRQMDKHKLQRHPSQHKLVTVKNLNQKLSAANLAVMRKVHRLREAI